MRHSALKIDQRNRCASVFDNLPRLLAGLSLALAVNVPLQAADGKPDFTGVYRSYRAPGGGFGMGPSDLPLTKDAQAKVDAMNELLEGTGETGGGWCLGAGMPGSMMGSGGYPMEIIQRPEQITAIYEAHGEIRRIYIGDDNQMAEIDKIPDRNGYSKGWWEGDELVVETTHLKEIVDSRYPHSENATVLERYHAEIDEQGNRILVATMTLTDPDFYTEPYETVKRWQLDPDGRMLPYECAEPNWYERIEEIRELKKQGHVFVPKP